MRVRSFIAAVILSLVALPAVALDGFITTRKLDAQRLPALVDLLRHEMTAKDGRFAFVSDAERESVDAALAEMVSLLAGKQGVSDLDEDDKVALVNAQARANAILTKRDRDRLICTRRAVVGTHRRETTCETYGEQVARTQRSRDDARFLSQPKSCISRAPNGEAQFCPAPNAGIGGG